MCGMYKNIGMLGKVVVAIFAVCASCNRLPGLHGDDVFKPFPECEEPIKLGGRNGTLVTRAFPLRDGAELAFYPMTNKDVMLYLQIMIRDVVFKVQIRGTMVTLEKCTNHMLKCKMESEEGVKHPNYIKPQQWNKVLIKLDSDVLEIQIGNRKVKSMSMVNYEALDEASWQVHADDDPSKGNRQTFLYLVQFNCKEEKLSAVTHDPHHMSGTVLFRSNDDTSYTTETTTFAHVPHETTYIPESHGTAAPHKEEVNPHTDHHHEGHSSSKYVGLVVGLVIAGIVIVTLAIVLYNVIKKKKSINLNERSPIKSQQQVTK